MNTKIDLHIHSNHSDGTLSPEEIVDIALNRDLNAISITDHDNISAIPIARDYAKDTGIEVIPGVEFSTQQGEHDVHILGYLFDERNDALVEYLTLLYAERLKRAQKILTILRQIGITIRIEEVLKKSRTGSIGRPHIADLLIEKGFAKNYYEAFYYYIGDKAVAYVPKFRYSPSKTIELIHNAGGIAIIAHPSFNVLEKYLDEWLEQGIDGLEVVHPRFSQPETDCLIEVADRCHLLKTGGSDCHGKDNAAKLGNYTVPISFLETMKETTSSSNLTNSDFNHKTKPRKLLQHSKFLIPHF